MYVSAAIYIEWIFSFLFSLCCYVCTMSYMLFGRRHSRCQIEAARAVCKIVPLNKLSRDVQIASNDTALKLKLLMIEWFGRKLCAYISSNDKLVRIRIYFKHLKSVSSSYQFQLMYANFPACNRKIWNCLIRCTSIHFQLKLNENRWFSSTIWTLRDFYIQIIELSLKVFANFLVYCKRPHNHLCCAFNMEWIILLDNLLNSLSCLDWGKVNFSLIHKVQLVG